MFVHPVSSHRPWSQPQACLAHGWASPAMAGIEQLTEGFQALSTGRWPCAVLTPAGGVGEEHHLQRTPLPAGLETTVSSTAPRRARATEQEDAGSAAKPLGQHRLETAPALTLAAKSWKQRAGPLKHVFNYCKHVSS